MVEKKSMTAAVSGFSTPGDRWRTRPYAKHIRRATRIQCNQAAHWKILPASEKYA